MQLFESAVPLAVFDWTPRRRRTRLRTTARRLEMEQLEGRDVDARSDLFSFGAVLFEMLTGTRAFEGDNAARVRSSP